MADADPEAFRAAIEAELPALRGQPLHLLGAGFHSIAIETASGLVIKMPRHREAEQALRREARMLAIIRPAVALTVPDMTLSQGPRLFSWHRKLAGGHILACHYDRLEPRSRTRLARDLAGFMAHTHALALADMKIAGAMSVAPWESVETIRRQALPLLPKELQTVAEAMIGHYEALPPDPHGIVYGHFDGHGWNMAFDHEASRLSGIYDFADSGLGPLHRDFVYSSLIAADLTARIIDAYEAQTGRGLDRRRIQVLAGMHRLSDLAELAGDDAHRQMAIDHVARWARWRSAS